MKSKLFFIAVALVFFWNSSAQGTMSIATSSGNSAFGSNSSLQKGNVVSPNLKAQSGKNAALTQNSYTYVGSFNVGDGPCWPSKPTTYSAVEAAALVFGGASSDYAISVDSNTTDQSTITHTAYLDGYANIQYYTTPAAEDFKQGSTYVPGSFSAYVKDNSDGTNLSCGYSIGITKTNYVWRVIAVTSPPTANDQSFCQGATVSSLVASGTSLQWFAVQTGGVALASDTVLVTGTYYVSQTVNGLESARTSVAVTVNSAIIPTFTAVDAIYSGATLSTLPTTSINGYTGTWSPALSNTATTTYTFTPDAGQCATSTTLTITVYSIISLVSDNTNQSTQFSGWNYNLGNFDYPMTTTDGINYSISSVFLTGTPGAAGYSSPYWVKFRQDNSWLINWGSSAFPSGTGIQNGENICAFTPGTYSVSFNIQTGAYVFTLIAPAPVVSIVGGSIGMPWTTDVDLTVTDGVNYSLTNYNLSVGELKFRQDHNWTVNWGGNSFTTGTGISYGNNIVATPAGIYDVSFNRLSLAYSFSQYTAIPDANFEQALFDLGIDTVNGDHRVLTSAIIGITNLNVQYKNIAELTGIQGFTALQTMSCNNNQLTSINLNGLIALTAFNCGGNHLTSIDVSGLTSLSYLACMYNQLSSLDLSGLNLTYLDCSFNQITNLNLIDLNSLGNIGCTSNQLTSLILPSESLINMNFNLDCKANPNLSCITVSDPVAAAAQMSWFKDATATYLINCANTNQTFCNTGTIANLTPNDVTIKWYAAATGGTKLASTVALTNPTYYFTQTVGGVEGPRNAISVVVNKPATPTATAYQTYCISGVVSNIIATGINISWYSSSTGGSPLDPSTPLASTNYYASQSINGCESLLRKAVTVTVMPSATPTAISPQTFCPGARVSNLVATGNSISWYTSQTGGTALPIATVLSSGTYYVSQKTGVCESLRAPVTVVINVTPTPITSPQLFCRSGLVSDLTATGTNIKWYLALTGGGAMASTTALGTKTYYATQTLNGCESVRTPVSVTIQITPAPTAVTQIFNYSATVSNLVATGSNILWYTTSTGGSPLSSSTLLSSATYYCSQTINGCESTNRKAVIVKVTVALVSTTNSAISKTEIPTEFKIYPNPTSNILSIETSNNTTINKVIVIDLLGKVILDETPVNNQINVERFAPGTYILQVFSGEDKFLTKFIKE